MRILKLSFDNLNSLYGHWEIDFTHADYKKNHDIFVIHGPTGAGKTTILDAITLALYGRTPRLESINGEKSGNEIMTRGSSFCSASVIYQCKKGFYKSEFSQSRARGKSSGNLQKADYKITPLNPDFTVGGISLTGRASNLKEETQKIIQLDYSQFCRSIMLAQGEFNTFLKCKSEDRAKILEKLTGTERYRTIGANIGNKFSQIKNAYNEKKENLEAAANELLSRDDIENNEKELKDSEKILNDIEKKLEKIQKEMIQCENLESLKIKLSQAEEAKKELEKELSDFEKEKERLNLAEKAKNCEKVWLNLSNTEKTYNDSVLDQKNFEKNLTELENQWENLKKLTEESQKNLVQKEEEYKNQQKLWIKVRSLDVKLAEFQKKFQEDLLRKDKSQSAVNDGEEKIKKIQQNFDQAKDSLESVEEYLKNHNDENLPQQLTKSSTIKEQLDSNLKKISQLKQKKEEISSQLEENRCQLEEKKSLLAKIEKQIADFICQDALFISRLLQLQLSEGQPCPVCGSPYHGVQEEKIPLDKDKSQKIAENSALLNKEREDVQGQIHNIQSQIESKNVDFSNTEDNLLSLAKENENLLSQINESLKNWLQSVDFDNFSQVIADLEKRSQLYENNLQQKNKLLSDLQSMDKDINANKENLQLLRENFQNDQNEYSKSLKELTELKNERLSLFGEKDLDEEENAWSKEVDKLKEEKEKNQKNVQKILDEKNSTQGQLKQVDSLIAESKKKLEQIEEEFSKKIRENGFNRREDFLSALMDENEFNLLTEKRSNLKDKKIQVETKYSDAKKSYEDFKNKCSIKRSKDEIQVERETKLKEKAETGEKISQIRIKLHSNEEKLKNYEEEMEKFQKLKEDFQIWEQISQWTGKKDGSDLSVFVQSLAFSSLLRLTNKNLWGITGRYKILQKSPLDLDFEISDIYFDQNRSIANLSGGEQFLVSLSLALGISEFASREVRVDSLFLDEGFGTLSGELLTQAINALKNLQKEGKMLGIITHVQDVITEIDQKIEVKPWGGGHSILTGSGVSRE